MAERTWKFSVTSKNHILRLTHNRWSGKRQICLDGKILIENRKFIDKGAHYYFSVGDVSCELMLTADLLQFDTCLLVDNNIVPATGKKPTIKKSHQKLIRENSYWREIARKAGLSYKGISGSKGSWRHRLVGSIHNLYTVVGYGQIPQTNIALISILVRYSPLLDKASTMERISKNPKIIELRGKLRSRQETLGVKEDHAWIAFQFHQKKDPAEHIAAKIHEFIELMSQYVRPLPVNHCEGKSCTSGPSPNIQYIFVNHFPLQLCENCIQEIPNWGKTAIEAYNKKPPHLVKGVIAGAIAALSGGITLGFLTIYVHRTASNIAILMMIGIVKIMDKVGTKRTIWSMLVAAVLSFIGVISGIYFSIVFSLIKNKGATIWNIRFLKIFEVLLSDSGLITIALVIYFLGTIPILLSFWNNRRLSLSKTKNPEIEIP